MHTVEVQTKIKYYKGIGQKDSTRSKLFHFTKQISKKMHVHIDLQHKKTNTTKVPVKMTPQRSLSIRTKHPGKIEGNSIQSEHLRCFEPCIQKNSRDRYPSPKLSEIEAQVNSAILLLV